MKIDILTYKRGSWFSKKVWTAVCQTKLPMPIADVYEETEEQAFSTMRDKIIAAFLWQNKDGIYNIRTLEIEIKDSGTTISSRWTGPALTQK